MILSPTPENIRAAAEALLRGELVGLPTETVYGVAAIATNSEAVLRVFALKGRPADNPLIVHIAGIDDVLSVAGCFPDDARALGEKFWPGPLTLVLPKAPILPDVVTAGLETVAVRVPNHHVALSLIEAVGAPLAAPSANSFMGLSPTRAHDIDDRISAGLHCILDGGTCDVGLESTVVDCTLSAPRVLRPGGISRAQIVAVVGAVGGSSETLGRRSPGQYPRHYAPKAGLVLVERLGPDEAGLTFDEPANRHQVRMPGIAHRYASELYSALHELDRLEPRVIAIQMPPTTPEWEAVWDRLRKASTEAPPTEPVRPRQSPPQPR